MTKLFALVAAFGLLAAPAFAIDEHKGAPAAAPAVKAETTVDCSKAADKAKCEAEAKIAAEKVAKEAPAAGEMKTETPAKH